MKSNNEVSSCNNISTVSNDIVLNISSYLGSKDLVSLALTCRRFGIIKEGNEDSLVNKAAQQIINSKWTSGDERHQLPKYNDESWLELYRELEVLRSPLIFDKLIGPDTEYGMANYIESKEIIRISVSAERLLGVDIPTSAAICNQIMRSGKHHVSFRFIGGIIGLDIGIIRPKVLDWEGMVCEWTERWGDNDIHYCAMSSRSGRSRFRIRTGHGGSDPQVTPYPRPVEGVASHIGMILDLGEGTLTAYIDGRRLGIRMRNLTGEFCWFVKGNVYNVGTRQRPIDKETNKVMIERGGKSPAFLGYSSRFSLALADLQRAMSVTESLLQT